MAHWVWIIINVVVIGGTAAYIWLFHPHPFAVIRSGQFAAQAAIVFFIVNLNMAFIFQVIKRSAIRNVKVTLAKLARRLMKWHIRIAIAGTALILVHAAVMLVQLGQYIGYFHPKMFSGYAAIALLALTLMAGYLRSRRASGFRRRFHLTTAFVFAAFFLAHIFIR